MFMFLRPSSSSDHSQVEQRKSKTFLIWLLITIDTVCVTSCGSSSSLTLSEMALEQLNTQGPVDRKWIKLPRLNYALSCLQISVLTLHAGEATYTSEKSR